ncbi:rade putative MSF transporter [Viridothelium virens]|uniref:Rade putative MSF transporter n=1 Tax=Viridothelium virens TaxID=1048519 RepID=A0A6A6HMC0_VIRVR|nr:rade putative MSF transporter [Viridothelium virens]
MPSDSASPQIPTKDRPLALDKEIEASPYQEVHDGKGPSNGKSDDSKSRDSQVSSVEQHQQPRHLGHTVDVEKGQTFDSSASEEPPEENVSPLRKEGDANTQDKNIVWWEEPADQDPANPLNWSAKKKWGNIAILSGITLVTPLASSIFAPVVPEVMAEFHSNSDLLATFIVSVYLLGFAFGPLIIGPLSEIYGRMLLYNISNVFFVAFTIGCALSTSLNMLFAFRVLAGLAGCTVLTIGGGTIADIFPQEKRGGAMAIWSLGPLLGPIIGPVAGGYLGQAKGWRWVFWLLVILAGFFDILCLVFCRETYAPVLLQRKTLRLQKETGNLDLRSKLDTGLTPIDLFKRSIIRPMKLLFFSPICTVLCIYTAIVYGILYLLYTTFTYVFEGQYGFSPGTVGLTYIGLGIGMILGMAIFGGASDRILKAKSKKGEMKPEYRLPPLVPGSFCVPIGLLIYGWTAKYHEQWAIPLLGTLIVGLGLLAVFMAIQTYLVDAYHIYAASAIAANTVLRSILGACFPLFGLQMYSALGLGWGNSLLAFIAVALCPVPVLLLRYGESIRKNPRFQLKL